MDIIEEEAVALLMKKPPPKSSSKNAAKEKVQAAPVEPAQPQYFQSQSSLAELEAELVEYKLRLVQVDNMIDVETTLSKNAELVNEAEKVRASGGLDSLLVGSTNNSELQSSLAGLSGQLTTQQKIEQLKNMQAELQEKISKQEDLIKNTRKQLQFSKDPLEKSMEGKVCFGFYEAERKWYAAYIRSVNEGEQNAEIQWVGINQVVSVLPAKYIKLHKIPDALKIVEGMFCEAIYYADGQWYLCVVEKVNEPIGSTYDVKFKQFGNKETVPLEFLKVDFNKLAGKKRLAAEEVDDGVFKTPEYLKSKKTDTEIQKAAKKKKVKALKANFKQKIIEKETKNKQDNWNTFNQKAGKSKRGYFGYKKNDSIFKSPDTVFGRVGVTGSGKEMTKLTVKPKPHEMIGLTEGNNVEEYY